VFEQTTRFFILVNLFEICAKYLRLTNISHKYFSYSISVRILECLKKKLNKHRRIIVHIYSEVTLYIYIYIYIYTCIEDKIIGATMQKITMEYKYQYFRETNQS